MSFPVAQSPDGARPPGGRPPLGMSPNSLGIAKTGGTGPANNDTAFWICFFRIAFAWSMIVYLYEAYAYNVVFLGHILPGLGRGAFTFPFLILFNLAWGLAFWSYIQAHLTDPGAVPQRWLQFVKNVGEDLPITPPRQEFQPGKATLCRRCAFARPERAHHCQFCGICVLRYDHHCPWINNCVGFNNHKHFLLVMIYSWLASFIGLFTCFPELMRCFSALVGMEDRSEWEASGISTAAMVTFVIFGFLAFLVLVLVSMLLHTYLPWATQNLTTVEETYANMANPFDLGNQNSNVAQIFGTFGPDWFFPVQPFSPQTDGVYFPRAGEDIPGYAASPRGDAAEQEIPMANRDYSRGGSAPGLLNEGTEELDVEKLWRLRYHVSRRAHQPRENTRKAKAWSPSCCSRVPNQEDEELF